ncbi:LacI family DNA-binding transcriptional regulator [Devosia rhodophyticola]|uniref:LacI family DNA-binding transcriptional regulator n=1 Tax=Devosia rhodophyticola TaxID=3026423 RepID=A0ABY7YXB7_9HYPH|nr:LacI family DNA-binding transcriptional regulator [Devosia rhodophyticola]WDR06006.1 LacI family DNA-binding transcriptional regulator [Devosia rhodophyticola]
MSRDNRPRALDIALRAGLSTSTVDRVLNGRGRVSTKAVQLVMQAQSELEQPASSPADTIEIILPLNAGNSTRYLGAFFRLAGQKNGVSVKVNWVDRMIPAALSAALLETIERCPRGVAFQALDDPLVHEAVAALRSKGVRLTTIVSDLTGEGVGYVGMDNRAAGRTAALLMGNYCAGKGTIAVVWSGQLSRAHEERESGFRALMRAEFPSMLVKDVNSGNDQPDENFRLIRELLTSDTSIAGVYCVGAGPSSIVDAAKATGQINRIKIFAHNLTHVTRAHLLDSEIDVVIHQNMHEIANRALAELLSDEPIGRIAVATHIITRENALHHLDLNAISDWLE